MDIAVLDGWFINVFGLWITAQGLDIARGSSTIIRAARGCSRTYIPPETCPLNPKCITKPTTIHGNLFANIVRLKTKKKKKIISQSKISVIFNSP